MPLCPQITNTPVTVVQNSDFIVSSVLPVVAATTTQVNTANAAAATALSTANAAQATANTALADAAIAFTAAQNSLQPSAFAIQNPTTKQLSAIDATGLTVYVNSPSAGARVVLNSAGLAGFNSGGSPTFSISASTGAAVFSGSVTGSTITGGTLNIGGNAIINSSGFLTATGATITGTITATSGSFTGSIFATSGYFGSPSTGWQFTSSGFLYSGDTFLYPTTIPGGNSNTFSIYTGRGIYADTLFITSATNAAVYSSGGLYALGALNTAAGGTGSPLFRVNTSGAITDVAGVTSQGSITTTGSITADGAATFANASGTSTSFQVLSSGLVRSLFTYNRQVSASTRAMLVDSSGNFGNATSTRRNKHEIESYKIDSKALLKLDVKTFKYKPELSPEQSVQYGFIAEEAQELGLDELIQYDETGIPSYFAYEKLPVFLLQLIQELKTEIDQLKGE
jgi:hypothetical protein